jgi:pantetheine-phosphate adenylyltransferase
MKKYHGKAGRPVIAVYPGSFDPVTNGHLDIIERGSKIFDIVIVAILTNISKTGLFAVSERKEMMERAIGRRLQVRVEAFDGLLIDFVLREGASVIVRGLRATSDFEYEFQMALMNRRLNSSIETVFMTPSAEYTFVSSKLVTEVVSLGGEVKGLVPPFVEDRLKKKLGKLGR